VPIFERVEVVKNSKNEAKILSSYEKNFPHTPVVECDQVVQSVADRVYRDKC